MNRKDFLKSSGFLGIVLATPTLAIASTSSEEYERLDFLPDINHLRKLSNAIVGDLPKNINVTKVADTIRPASVVVKGESDAEKMILARTVYQLIFPKGTIMLNSGMDYETHKTFGKTEEPYYPENYEIIKKALLKANLIVLTHYHADHTGGVVRSENFEEIAHKVWLSEDTAKLMINKPHKETIKITQEKVNQFIISDFKNYHPVAPGVVLFKTPGHTPDSKMIYIKLKNGQEFIHSVDSGWSMKNITTERMKNASWVNEDEQQLLEQYKWLNHIIKTEKNIIVLCTHDNEQYNDFTKNGILVKGLEI